MTNQTPAPCLNPLIVAMGRSFLQYVGEAWPWADDSALARRETILSLVGRQQCDIAALVNAQMDAHIEVDFGAFPTEYTDLHYIDVDVLLAELIRNQKAVIDQLVAFGHADCPTLSRVLENERGILSELEAQLAASKAAVA